jgi:hypothetical protein
MCCTFATWIALTAKQLQNPKDTSWGKGVIAMIFFHNFFYNFAWYVQEIMNLPWIHLGLTSMTGSL